MTVVNIDWCDKGVAMQHDWSDGPICKSCGGTLPDTDTQFAQRLEGLLNAHSQENASNTPDFILAQYLLACLAAWNTGVQQRENWYGRDPRPTLAAASTVLRDPPNRRKTPTTGGQDHWEARTLKAEQRLEAAERSADEAVAAWHKENDLRHDAEEAKEAAEATIARLREAIKQFSRVTYYGQAVPPEGPYVLVSELHPLTVAALAALPSPPVSAPEEDKL